MPNVTIVSHLTPMEWKMSWDDKVVEDSRENMKDYQSHNCYWGHFSNDSDFTICFHKEFEVKGMSMGLYFNGHLDWDEQGSRITGKFAKKRSANLFLFAGAILCLLCIFGGLMRGSTQLILVAGVLLVILVIYYMVKPNSGQERILEELKKISFDDAFSGRDRYRNRGKSKVTKANKRRQKQEQRSMQDKSAIIIEEGAEGIVEKKTGIRYQDVPQDEPETETVIKSEN